ncbi:calcium channel flower [Parasteatoda tepidariorum]|uniref:calcium channel flower n=1 Tax=Parasteatoda tepidariorum TaxID=114398 RepID=UPI00077F90A8|nr:calcium channel flower [Parasteatoda tepidariorum]
MMKPEPSTGPVRPQQTAVGDEFPWWIRYGVRFMGSISAVAALALGAMACITLTPRCLLAGILQMLIGVLVALIEAPFLCMFLDFAQIPSAYFDSKPTWLRGLLYIFLAIWPLSLCVGLSTFFGSGLVFLTGSMYGLLSLKRKAPLQGDMRMQASSSYNLMQNQQPAGDVESGMPPKYPGNEKMSGVI